MSFKFLQCLWPVSLGVVFLATVLEVAGKTPCHAMVPQDPGDISGRHLDGSRNQTN